MISIIMPAKNAGKYIEDSIASIQQQSEKDWELIVVDDHSTDDTFSIVETCALSDSRIRLFKNSGSGILPALQLAQGKLEGNFVTRMDSDDLMPEGKLETLLNLLQKSPRNTLVTGKVQYFSDKPVSEGYRKYENWLNAVVDQNSFFTEIYRECTIASPNWMMPVEAFLGMKGVDGLQYPEDYDMVFRLKREGIAIKAINQVTHLWREHPDRASRNLADYQQEAFFRLKLDHFLTIEWIQDSELVLWGTARKGKLVAKMLLEKQQPFIWMDWKNDAYQAGIYQQTIHSLEQFDELSNPLVINTVVPPEHQQRQIDQFTKRKGLTLGENYFIF